MTPEQVYAAIERLVAQGRLKLLRLHPITGEPSPDGDRYVVPAEIPAHPDEELES